MDKYNCHFIKPAPSRSGLYTFLSVAVLGLFLLLGCKTSSIIDTKKEAISYQKTLARAPTIVTFILKITKEEKGSQPFFELYKKVEAKGYLKNTTHINKPKLNGSFSVELINTAGKVIQTNIFTNPLLKSYEFADENGIFQRKEVTLTEEYISIRTQKSTIISALYVYLIEEKKQILLQKITLE